jgi:hypothetical protein
VLQLHEIRYKFTLVGFSPFSVHVHIHIIGLSVDHEFYTGTESAGHGLLALLEGGFAVRDEVPVSQFAASLQGKSAYPARLIAVTDKIQCLPHSLTAASECLHQEGLGLVICQNLLSHIVILFNRYRSFKGFQRLPLFPNHPSVFHEGVSLSAVLRPAPASLPHTHTAHILYHPVGIRVAYLILRHELSSQLHRLVGNILRMCRTAYHRAQLLFEQTLCCSRIEILCHNSKF